MRHVKIIIATTLTLTSIVVFAQDQLKNQIPSIVLNKFEASYPNAFDVEWEKHGKYYEVDFETQSNIDHEIWYNSLGDIIRQKDDIQEYSLPNEVKNTISKNYGDYVIEDIEKITQKSYVTYVVELEKYGSDIQVIFDKKGKEISKKID